MELKTKKLSMDAGGKAIIVLNKKDAKTLGVFPLNRVIVKTKKGKITCVVNITDNFVSEGEAGLFQEVYQYIPIRNREKITVQRRGDLVSKKYIDKKIEGQILNEKEYSKIVEDVIKRNLNDLELASFITALHIHGINFKECAALTNSMVKFGKRISFGGKIADKHSIGGVPGDKTSLLVVPTIASTGIKIPKTSSRSITDPAGTADRMEVLAPVEFGVKEIKEMVKKTKGCVVWGGSVELAPSDDLFIEIEKPLMMDPLMLPSVMSKKKSVGSRYLAIDIPMGNYAKVRDIKEAYDLGKKFSKVGSMIGIKTHCLITNASQPIGFAMGPVLEAKEAMFSLENPDKAPKDLIDKVASICGVIMSLTDKGNKNDAIKIIESGKAEEKMREIIKYQGGDSDISYKDLKPGKYKKTIKSKKSGVVISMNNSILRDSAKLAGAPVDKGAGILMKCKIGDKIKKGETLLEIYSERKELMKDALNSIKNEFIRIGNPSEMVIDEIRHNVIR